MKLLSAYNRNHLKLSNRMVMAPMTRTRADNKEHKANALMAEYYEQRASAGLIISEGTAVNPEGVGYIHIPGLYTQAQVEGWKQTTEAVHKKGGKIFAQLWHVGRISHPSLIGGQRPVAPSAINAGAKAFTHKGFTDTVEPKAMTLQDIEKTISDFQQATVNAIEAGFDGVEIHGANGYLFHQFFMKCSNIRTDKYGGNIENRARFLFEVIERIGEKVSLSKVGVRLAPDLEGVFGIEKDEDTEAQFDYITEKLNDYDLAYLHISGFRGRGKPTQESARKRIVKVAEKYRKLYRGTFIINGSFDRDSAEEAVQNGVTDLVAFGNLFIANPDLVERFKEDAPLNSVDKDTVYATGSAGYTDYTTLAQQQQNIR